MPILSIVTPTYNRADLLIGCYEALLRQTNKDFEWIIVDDGSTDDTKNVVDSFITRLTNDPDGFSIKYIYKENGGKHTALNTAAKYVSGKYILFLDSDDYLTPNAVEKSIGLWKRYEENPSIGVVIFLKGETKDRPCCTVAENDTDHPVDLLKAKRITYIHSDCCEVVRSDLVKLYPYPEYPDERFLAEGALWNQIGLTHLCVYSNEVIYICKYLDGGLTNAGRSLRIHNPNGGMYNAAICMKKGNRLKIRMKNAVLYSCYGFFANKTVSEMKAGCSDNGLMIACLPFGRLLFLFWKKYL